MNIPERKAEILQGFMAAWRGCAVVFAIPMELCAARLATLPLVARSATPSLFLSGASAPALPNNLLLLSRIGVGFWLKFGPWMQ